MPDDSRTSAWIQVGGVVAAALIAAGVAIWTQRSASPSPGPAIPSGPPVMGQLEVGINRQGMDLSAEGRVTANAEICAELCRTSSDCRAMTYVISHGTCWLKAGVPQPWPPGGPDFVSAVKQ